MPRQALAACYAAYKTYNRDAARRFLTLFEEQHPAEHIEVADEIRLLNRFWRRQLSTLDENTIEIRECLMDSCNLEDWIRHFQTTVCPILHANNLPIL